jgi:hypothetical protein
MTWRRTNYSTDLSNTVDLISHIGADSNGHILLGESGVHIDELGKHDFNRCELHYSPRLLR